MASWGASAPTYPPSHSRSPRHRDAYPDTAPAYPVMPATYRGEGFEWDEHRKAWDEYYDRRVMARSRSPTGEDASRKRRRSPSPYERDRFDPRPRYGDDYDTHSRVHGYTSPRRGSYHLPPSSLSGGRRPPMDPYAMEPSPASLRQFAEWFRYYYPSEAKEEDNLDRAAEKEAGMRTRDGIRMRWEKYKKQHTANQLQTLFDHHKKSPWFSEKYNPSSEWVNLRSRVRKQGWKGRPEQFLKDLAEGRYDYKPEAESTSEKEKEQKQEQEHEKAKGNEQDTIDEAKPANEMDGIEDETREIGPDSPTKSETNGKPERMGRDDEVLVTPDGLSMAIRTIPPDIGRLKIEEACHSVPGFVHLALGEPLQKKNYYRAGWIKFRDDTDMPTAVVSIGEKKIEGFKLHVHHVARPFYARLRTAPEIASTPERLEKDLQQAKQLATILEDEYATLRRLPEGVPEPKIEDGNGKKKLQNGKDGDVVMAEPEAVDSEAERREDSEDSVLELLEKGSEALERRIGKLVDEMQQEDGTVDPTLEAKKTTLALDMYLAYLRAAFNTCYYCAAVCDHVEELQRKCPNHVRKPLSEKTAAAIAAVTSAQLLPEEGTEDKEEEAKKEKDKEKNERRWEKNDERWQEWVDSKIALLINRSGIDPTDYGGKNYEEELTKAVEPHTKQEDEGKFRCRTCQKLFKATAFVEKHVANKHPELVRQLEDLPFFNSFALDPHRIQPFMHLPQQTGNSAVPPPQAYGLQGSYGGLYSNGAAADYYNRALPGYYPPGGYGPYANGDYYGAALPSAHHWGGAGRREEVPRRLHERMGGYVMPAWGTAGLPSGVEGLPPKPASVGIHEPGSGRGGGRRGRGMSSGGPPPPPPDAKEDPRASGGKKVSYHDMDEVAEGDVELTY